jgi:hypothetical protein
MENSKDFSLHYTAINPLPYAEQRYERLRDSVSEYLDDDVPYDQLVTDLKRALNESRVYYDKQVAKHNGLLNLLGGDS